ncbi:phosphonate ABC transporter substrate-binding protein [Sphingomonas sp. PP-CE-3A-406]|uniref:phosphate/phosphite/phosphonate ABC transporter substrate-binding protein n=1 Tax=Sphingomonas sp. PP-CE-3A-406 TaxID=2135659 RepID=UPI000F2B93D3|nr:PhnD/SsuA/transferrin family substrate-binding protein [Sphingomonas sp. PP-CE-3A-406]RMB54988.1 phosphonate ABC transporter substrate-binding protein [Sphingomonas sp. PP-CE-3A-406]
MYDHPAQRPANDRLWAAMAEILRSEGVADVPDTLDRSRDVHALWRDSALLFGQACGYPLIADSSLALRVLALPVYATPGCVGASHTSVIVARADDVDTSLDGFRQHRAAINDRRSNTGMNLLRATIAPVAGEGAFFSSVIETGSHRASMIAVGAGQADIAAIDCVTYAAIGRFEPAVTTALRIVAHSPASPTLPFVTAASTSAATVAALRVALNRVMVDPDLVEDRAHLFLTGAIAADRTALAPIAALEAAAIRAGYAELR